MSSPLFRQVANSWEFHDSPLFIPILVLTILMTGVARSQGLCGRNQLTEEAKAECIDENTERLKAEITDLLTQIPAGSRYADQVAQSQHDFEKQSISQDMAFLHGRVFMLKKFISFAQCHEPRYPSMIIKCMASEDISFHDCWESLNHTMFGMRVCTMSSTSLSSIVLAGEMKAFQNFFETTERYERELGSNMLTLIGAQQDLAQQVCEEIHINQNNGSLGRSSIGGCLAGAINDAIEMMASTNALLDRCLEFKDGVCDEHYNRNEGLALKPW